MNEPTLAFVRRQTCGCVVAVVVEDEHFHYAQTLRDWTRRGSQVEKITIEAAREELGKTFARMDAIGFKGGHPAKSCRDMTPRASRKSRTRALGRL